MIDLLILEIISKKKDSKEPGIEPVKNQLRIYIKLLVLPGKSVVANLEDTVGVDEQVARLDIPVDNTVLMAMSKSRQGMAH